MSTKKEKMAEAIIAAKKEAVYTARVAADAYAAGGTASAAGATASAAIYAGVYAEAKIAAAAAAFLAELQKS